MQLVSSLLACWLVVRTTTRRTYGTLHATANPPSTEFKCSPQDRTSPYNADSSPKAKSRKNRHTYNSRVYQTATTRQDFITYVPYASTLSRTY